MASPKIVYTDQSTMTYYALGGTTTNLNSYEPTDVWTSTVTTQNQHLYVDLGTAQTVGAVVLDNHNINSLTLDIGLSISGSTNGTSWTDIVTGLNSITADPYIYTFTGVSYRYVGINFKSTAPLDTEPIVGNFWVGNPLTFTTAYNWGYNIENAEYATNEMTALNGTIRSSQAFAGRIIYEVQFTLQGNTFATGFKTFHRGVRGSLYPFYFLDADGSTVRYMHIEDYTPITVTRYGQNDVSLRMRTHLSTY